MKGCDRIAWSVLVAFALVSTRARAEVLIDTVLGDQTATQSPAAYYIHNFPSAPGSVADDLRTAVPFDVAANHTYAVDSVTLNVAARNSANQHLTVTLSRPDAGGLPGATVASYGVTNLPVVPDGSGPITYPLTSVPTPDHPVLAPGKYWISLSTPDANLQSDIYWFDRQDLPGRVAQLSSPLNGTAWQNGTASPTPQVRVSATLVPEPAGALFVILGVLLGTRRRRSI